jgi:hypothetical protein
MPEQAEYSLNGRKVRELRERVLVQGQKAWEKLKPFGFTSWHEKEGWIGCWVERNAGDSSTSFGIQLDQEDPIRFRVDLNVLSTTPTKEQPHVSFSRTFDSIASLETELPDVMKEVLAHVSQ